MVKRVQIIRHITSAADAFLGQIGEVTVDTTKSALRVHDGLNAGGHETAKIDASNIQAATNAQAGKATAAHITELEDLRADLTVAESEIDALEAATPPATNVTYSNTTSGLAATNVQTALDEIDGDLDTHIADVANPHVVTKAQVGLTNVTDNAQLKIASDLADLNDVPTARGNLGLGTAAILNTGTSNGDIALIGAGDKLPASIIPEILTEASKTEMEAAAASDVFVSPAVAHYAQSAAKAWVVFNGSGTVAIITDYNIVSVTDNGIGDYTITFDEDFSTAYTVSYFGTGVDTTSLPSLAMPSTTNDSTVLAGSIRVITTRLNGGASEIHDPNRCRFTFFGDQ